MLLRSLPYSLLMALAVGLASQSGGAADRGTPVSLETRHFSFQDERYLYPQQKEGAAVVLPRVTPGATLPLVVVLHGVNTPGDLHLWLGGGGRDLRPLVVSLMQREEASPFLLAAPSQTRGAGSTRTLWSGFDLGAFVDAVASAVQGATEVDRAAVVLVGHSGAGCNPDGGLASDWMSSGALLPKALVSIDPCLDAEMGMAMARRPASLPLLLWWQWASWPREPLEFWSALTLNQPAARLDRMLTLDVDAINPHEAIVPLAFERAVRELLPRDAAPAAESD